MKPSANLLFGRRLLFLSSVIAMTGGALAAPVTWSGATAGSWADAANWTPATVPTSADIATFNLAPAPITINLNGNQEVAGLATPSAGTTNVHTLLGGGTDRTLTIGASGISHLSGGLTIGSGTAGQRVDILLADTQTWDSSRASGTGTAQAVFVNNNVTLKAGLGTRTLTLGGLNTGSLINGIVGNEAGSNLNIVKTGSGIWTLNGANTYTGTTQVDAGTLRLGAVGTIAPSSISVASNATLALKTSNGTIGFTDAEIDTFRAGVNFATGSFLGLDTTNGTSTYAGSITGNIKLAKTGGNFLILSGTNTLTGGTIVREGGLILSNTTSLSGPITVAGNTAIIARAGGSGFTAAEIAALRTSVTIENTGYFGISTFNGDYSYGNVLPNTDVTRFTKAEANTLFLTAQNTYTGGTQITGGILSVSDIKNGGLASQIGASSNVANGLIFAGGRLQYTGAGATTDRLFNLTGGGAIEASGTGALVFNNAGTITTEGNSRTLNLTGYNRDDNRLGLNLANGSATTSVVKNGYGRWILSGNNTHTGTTTVRGGTLVFDYTGGKTPVATTAQVLVQNGTAHFQGSGAKTIGSLNFAEAENGFATIKVSGGMNLTATSLVSGTTNSQRQVLIDLSGTGNTLSYGTVGTNLTNTASGNLLLTGGTRSNIVVRANDGSYGFAAATGGTIQKLAGQTVVPAGTTTINSATTNYILGAGTYTSGGTLNYQTVTFDSSAGAINYTFASGHGIAPSGNGRGLLFSGANDVNLSGTGGAVGASTWFHNYLDDTAALNVSNPLGTGGFLIVGGTGFTNFTGSSLAASQFVLNGGLFRIGTAQNLTGTYRVNNAVLEIGANLSNGGAADLNQTNLNFTLNGDAGFSAFGATRSVSLGADVTWGAAGFLTSTAGDDGDHAFRLSSTRSNATVDFKSNINLNGKARTVDVENGSAAIDARLSGNLTGSGIASRFVKTGAGTLELTGTNTYSGVTRVEGGKLMVGGGGLNATTGVHVRNSTLEFTGAEVINNGADVTLENGRIISNGFAETMGRLTLIGDNTLDLVSLGNIVRMGNSSGVTWSSTLSILNWNGNSLGGGPDQFFIGTDQTGVTGSQLSKIFFVDPEIDGILRTGTYGANILATGEIVAVIPEPSATVLLAGAACSLAFFRRRRI